jgi:AAA domain-containing protein
MVGALSRHDGRRRVRRPLLVELAGPAGVGKSTLSATLVGRLNGTPETIWGLPVLPLLGNGLRLMPSFGGLWLHSKCLLWDETRHMVRLQTLHRALRQTDSRGPETVIFDEGPVFAMAWLRGFGHELLRAQPSAEWWEKTLRDWAPVFDAVVVLDAPDQLLARRIRARPHPHEVKEFSDAEIARWMARFRQALDWVLVGMARHGGPVVVRLPINDEPADQLAERLLEILEESPRGR